MGDTRITQETLDRMEGLAKDCPPGKRKEGLAKVWAFLYIGKAVQDREDAELVAKQEVEVTNG